MKKIMKEFKFSTEENMIPDYFLKLIESSLIDEKILRKLMTHFSASINLFQIFLQKKKSVPFLQITTRN
jgi:hypothetical protein